MTTRNAVDLHVHSNCSDGVTAPGDLPAMAEELGLAAVALTDHDTVDGVPEFLSRAADYPELKLYSGVELSSAFHYRELHIVGLGVNPQSPELLAFLEAMRQERLRRAETMAVKLAACGYPLPEAEWRSLKVVGRMHFARLLAARYPFSSLDEIFEKLLKRNMPGFVQRRLPSPEEAINIIHASGGAAVWAHPVFAAAGERSWMRKVLKRIVPAGLDGIEVHYAGFSPEQTAMAAAMAQEFHLFASGGSDFHGGGPNQSRLGVGYGNLSVPSGLLAALDQRIAAISGGL